MGCGALAGAATPAYAGEVMRYLRFAVVALAAALVVSLAACGSGGSATAPSVPLPGNPGAPTPSPVASAPTLSVGFGQTNGTDPISGTSPGGNTVDGIPCTADMPTNYHVHFFVGVYSNMTEIEVPGGVGMVNPGPPDASSMPPNQILTWTCAYRMHTHDNSGMIHIENDSPTCGSAPGATAPCSMSIYNFGDFLDIWGVSIGASNFGPLTGPVQIYTQSSTPAYCTSPCTVSSNTLSLYTGDPRAIPLYSHTVIWILVGSNTPPPASLPNVFFEEGDP